MEQEKLIQTTMVVQAASQIFAHNPDKGIDWAVENAIILYGAAYESLRS